MTTSLLDKLTDTQIVDLCDLAFEVVLDRVALSDQTWEDAVTRIAERFSRPSRVVKWRWVDSYPMVGHEFYIERVH